MVVKAKGIRLGDVFEIPLRGGCKGYGQYVFRDETMGPLIQVFDLTTAGDHSTDQVIQLCGKANPLFPPIITGLFAAVRANLWKVVGRLPVEGFAYQGFVSVHHEQYQKRGWWSLWDGKTRIPLGSELPNKYKCHEFLAVWDPHGVAYRIETGENPYKEMINRG